MEKRTFRPYFDLEASGKKMRQLRRERNISVEQVREYMGFESVQAIYKWERGECLPQADTLIALSLLYQVNPIELLEEDASAPSFDFAEKKTGNRLAGKAAKAYNDIYWSLLSGATGGGKCVCRKMSKCA